MASWENNKEIEIFREYLRIPSVHPNIDYTACVEFLKRQANELGLPVEVYHGSDSTKPIVVMKWLGQQPALPAIMLNSHMDVVPVFPEKWTHPPFAAEIDAEGRIFARGAQDMKCVGAQYMAAVRSLKSEGFQPKRTVYLIFVPDEEIGGHTGMEPFVKTSHFQKLNIAFSLDEGIASNTDTYMIYYAERSIWQIKFTINGTAGHALYLLKNTAGEKLQYILTKMMQYRRSQEQLLENDQNLSLGEVTSVNLTVIKGGVQANVVPPVMEAMFDCRLGVNEDHLAFENKLKQWCAEAGGDIEISFEQKEPKVAPTKLDDSNPYWLAFKEAIDDLGLKVNTRVCPGATDSRYVRNLGVPAIGFSPMKLTPILLHDHDEFLRADTYLEGIEIYKKLIPALANA